MDSLADSMRLAGTWNQEPDWHKLVEALPAAVYTCDAGGGINFFNSAAAVLWGRSPTLGQDRWCGSWRLLRADGVMIPNGDCPMARTLREGQPVRGMEMVVERPDGSMRRVRAHPELLFDARGAVAGAVNLLLDVTEHRSADVARHQLAAIVQSSDDAIISKDLNGFITSWNRGAERLFGYVAEEAVGRPVTMLIPPDRIDEEPGVLSRIRRGESIDHYETIRRCKDGRLVDISLSVSPVIDSSGQIIGASKIARDITERKQSELALVRADRHKDEFLATLAHELRNPLAPLRNCIDLLRLHRPERPVPRDMVDMMDRQVNHLVRLVDDLMELSRISRGLIELKNETVELGAVLRDSVEVSNPLIEARHHRLEVSIPPEEFHLTGDRTRLIQIVANLLNNAARFTPQRGLIRLSLERIDGQAVVRVADNGIGIPQESQATVFDMFTQVRRTNGSAGGGLGIGLSLARQLVELHGGDIKVFSEGADRGSEFIVRLPLALPAASTGDEPQLAGHLAQSPRRRVLVVDDNRDAAECLVSLLRSLGHEVRAVHDGIEALEWAELLQPELVLLDIGLPEMNGYEVARRLRRLEGGESLRLVALTGWGQSADRQRSAEAGFDRHLVKPVDLRILGELLAECPRRPLRRSLLH